MVQVGYKLWNVSILSVLVLTGCNILLTFRLLQTECTSNNGGGEPAQNKGNKIHRANFAFLRSSENDRNGLTILDPFGANSSHRPIEPKLGRWDNRRMLLMLDHAIIGSKYLELSNKFSVCLATQSSLEKLHSLVQVAHHWNGPISVALFAAGDDEFMILQGYIEYWRRCYPVMTSKMTIHLAFPKDKVPTSEKITKTSHLDCKKPEAALEQLLKQRSPEMIRWRIKNPYPQNHLRNLARKNCLVHNVFLTDIDIVPSYSLAEDLNTFLTTAECKGLCSYVIPTYELDERVPFPKNKSELIRLTKKGLARPFHQKVFIYNQFATNFSRWEQEPNSKTIHVSYMVTNFEFLYEPFYVSPDTVPPHDERFLGYGFTRNTQVYEMFVAGYQFYVLSPCFTVHWGLQNRKGRPSWRERQNSNNRKSLDHFKLEVFARYHKDPLNMVVRQGQQPNTNLNNNQ